MSDLDKVKGLIASGDKENAIALLASLLIKDKNQLDAWLLMGDMIDNPSWKMNSYQQVLKLSPQNSHALTKLRELQELPLAGQELASTADPQSVTDGPPTVTRKRAVHIPNPDAFRPIREPTGGGEVIGYLFGGIAGFLVLLYIIGNPNNFSGDSNSLLIGLIFLSFIAFLIVLSVSTRNRS